MKLARLVRAFTWLHPGDCIPPHGLDMQWKHDSEKVEKLAQAFGLYGFDVTKPALVGYPLDGRVQLLSGTHRHAAAERTGVLLPVTIWLNSDVRKMWGTPLWDEVIRDIPVEELMKHPCTDGLSVIPYNAVEFPA